MADQVVIWSPEALEDVDDIAGYIARDSVFYAAAVVEENWGHEENWKENWGQTTVLKRNDAPAN